MLNDEYIHARLYLSHSGTAWIQEYDFRFKYREGTYGNGTTMVIYKEDGTIFDVVDIRYDTRYNPNSDTDCLRYVIDFIFDNMYTGEENGSADVNGVDACIKVDL